MNHVDTKKLTLVIPPQPTDETDLRVVCKIIEAAIWYTVEEDVDLESLVIHSSS